MPILISSKRSPSFLLRSRARRLACITTAAAFASSYVNLIPSAAFTTSTKRLKTYTCQYNCMNSHVDKLVLVHSEQTTARRSFSLFNNKSNNEENKGGNLVDSAKNVAKKFLPKKWFQTEEEKQIELQKKQVQDEIKGGIKEVLKDAPLPVRMLGSMAASLVGSAMSEIGTQIQQQQKELNELIEDARSALVSDPSASALLGETIQIQTPPFSQSSSTSIINGATTKNINASFNVIGSSSSGVVTMSATQSGISSLILNCNGRSINVTLSKSRVGGGGNVIDIDDYKQSTLGKNRNIDKDDIIDVEFVEKEKTK